MAKKQIEIEQVPDTTDAERWLDPDRFVWHKATYRVLNDGTIIKES